MICGLTAVPVSAVFARPLVRLPYSFLDYTKAVRMERLKIVTNSTGEWRERLYPYHFRLHAVVSDSEVRT